MSRPVCRVRHVSAASASSVDAPSQPAPAHAIQQYPASLNFARSSRGPDSRLQRLDKLAALALVCLAATLGLGDIAQVSPIATLLGNTVRALLPLVIFLALLTSVTARRWPRFPACLALPSAAWLAVLVASALTAATRQTEAIDALVRPASGALLVWTVYEVCRGYRRWRLVLEALALGGFATAVIAVAEAVRVPLVEAWLASVHNGSIPIGDVPRAAATLSHPNEAAMFLELTLPILVACAWTAAPRWRPPLTLAAAGTLLAIALTFSRAGIIAALVSIGLLAGLCIRRASRTQLALLGVVALAVPLALGWASVMDPGLDRRLLAGVDESSTAQPTRAEFWSSAVAMFRDHPLLGVGPDNFRWRFAAYSGVPADNLGIHAHDQYLETLADTGLLGLATLLWLWLGVARVALAEVREERGDWPWRAALMASLAAWAVHAVLDDFERFWPTSIAFWLIVGLTVCRPEATARAD